MKGVKLLTNEEFINEVGRAAVENMIKYRLCASLVIAQAILESKWGKSGLAVKSKNLFGVKGRGTIGSDLYKTREWCSKRKRFVYVNAKFRKYRSFAESINDHKNFLLKPRYIQLIGEYDYKDAARKIKQAGYATDPRYVQKIVWLIEKYNLARFDKQALEQMKK